MFYSIGSMFIIQSYKKKLHSRGIKYAVLKSVTNAILLCYNAYLFNSGCIPLILLNNR